MKENNRKVEKLGRIYKINWGENSRIQFFVSNQVGQMEASSNDIGEGDKKDLKSALQNIKLKQKLGKIVNKTAVRRYQLLE